VRFVEETNLENQSLLRRSFREVILVDKVQRIPFSTGCQQNRGYKDGKMQMKSDPEADV
jgi:hypothetical protein